jgi:hypothetical protein
MGTGALAVQVDPKSTKVTIKFSDYFAEKGFAETPLCGTLHYGPTTGADGAGQVTKSNMRILRE